MSEEQGKGGLFAAVKNIAAVFLASGKTRLELLGNEIEEEKLHIIDLVLLAQGIVLCTGVFSLLIVMFMTVAFWEHRLIVLGIAIIAFILLGGLFVFLFKRSIRRKKHIFEASLAELEKDVRQLKAAINHEQSAQ